MSRALGILIVGMNDEAEQTVLLMMDSIWSFQRSLEKSFRIEHGIVLARGNRQLHDPADEVGHHRAPAALNLQMSHVRHRHIVGDRQRVVPVRCRSNRPNEARAPKARTW